MSNETDSPDLLVEQYERAKEDPDEDYYLVIEIRTLLRHIDDGGEEELEYVSERLGDIEVDHPLFDALESLHTWEASDHSEFEDGARAAVEGFAQAYERARERGWRGVAILALEREIELRANLGGFDLRERLEYGLDLLETEYRGKDVHRGQLSTVLDLVVERADTSDQSLLERTADLCVERASILHEQSDYPGEREYLRRAIEVEDRLDESVTHLQQRMIKSIEAEREQKSGADPLVRASVLETGLKECHGYLPDEVETHWRRTVRDLNRKGIEAMPQVETEIDAEDFEADVDQFVEVVEKAADETSTTAALLMSIYVDYGYPDPDEARAIAEEYPISEVLPQMTISPEGDSVGFRPSITDEVDRVTNSYQSMMQYANAIIVRALHQLVETRTIREEDFYLALETIPGITVDDTAFLTDAIIAFFEGRYSEALHLLIPRLESVTVHVFEAQGEAVTKNVENAIHQRNLGGLFGIIEEEYDEAFGRYLQHRYTDTSGTNLRNRVSHGQLRYRSADFGNTVLALYDILRIAGRISNEHESNEDPE